jgi:resuscitation-promoting factor RpfB
VVDENGNPVLDPPVASTTLLQISVPAGATTKPPKTTKSKSTKAPTSKKPKSSKPPSTAVAAAEAPPSTIAVKVGKSESSTVPEASAKGFDASITTVLPPDQVPNSIPDETWLALRKCESNNRYDINTGNGYYGAYQFAAGTWKRLGYSGLPHRAAPAVQDEAAKRLQAKAGWGQWPACTRKLGLR